MTASDGGIGALAARFAEPGGDVRPWTFWFLNDALDERVIDADLTRMAEAGFGTVVPHARMGLDPAVGYLTPRWWELLRHVAATCERLGLRIVLYDEASYPSGSANGAVVAENAEFAARCLVRAEQIVDVRAGEVRYARPTLGRGLWDRRLVTVVLDADGPRAVPTDERGLVRLDAPGIHRVVSVFDSPSGGTIRGAHVHQDDGSPLAPAAADLMNPEAVAAFRRLTHDRYAEHLGPWFGSTVVGLFTDEPSVGGRGPRPDSFPWTPGLEDDVARVAGTGRDTALERLALLWEPEGTDVRSALSEAVSRRVADVYYGAHRQWCDEHGLALTGHPLRADEVRALDAFTWPGQDTIWRWVLPGDSALHGDQSVAPRDAGSARLLGGRDRSVTEIFGAYGWRLSLDEVKWLCDWSAVRGITDFLLHAVFSSVRGNRAFESEPDVGWHNAWWPHLPVVLRHLARMTLLNRALAETPGVAVLVTDDTAPAADVVRLYQLQVPFAYVPADELDVDLTDPAHPRLVAGPVEFAAVLVPHASAAHPSARLLAASGVRVTTDPASLGHLAPDWLSVRTGRRDDLRVRPGTLGTLTGALVTNEGEDPIVLDAPGVDVWDPWTGTISRSDGSVDLGRRTSLWLVRPAVPGRRPPAASRPDAAWREVALSTFEVTSTTLPVVPTALGDWCRQPGLETAAGSASYSASFELPRPCDLRIDLGSVGELAEVRLNGRPVAHLFWAPYECRVDASLSRAGTNRLEVVVTNSSANHWEGALRPSGLIGPVRVESAD